MLSAARWASLVLCVLLAAGCATTVEVRGPIQPAAVPVERSPFRAVVIFPQPLGYYGESVRVGRVLGIPQTLYFDYGDVLWDALFRSTLAVYKDVTNAAGTPRPGQYDRIVKFFVQDPKESGTRPVLTASGDRFSIGVTVEVLDGSSLEPLQRTLLQRSVTYSGEAEEFEKAIENLIRQLSDDVAKLLAAPAAP